MSLPPEDQSPQDSDLQFDHAEPEGDQPQSIACAACHQPILDAYYEINGQTICSRCREAIMQSLTGGSRLGRFVRATVFGTLAGLLGALLWGGIRTLTGYEIGLIAVLVGLIVGKAVRIGSRGRGGLAYQLLAVLLTYSSVSASLMPAVIMAFRDEFKSKHTTTHPAGLPTATSRPAATTQPTSEAKEDNSISKLTTGEKIGAVVFMLIFTFVIAATIPFYGHDLLWLLIIGFALLEAWKLNKAPKITINGPFQLNPGFGDHVLQ
jgi:hypothetical protein